MLALKRLVTILVMLYLLLALLLILSPATRDTFASTFGLANDLGTFYNTLFIIGAVLLGLHLITENIDSILLRREIAAHQGKVNELKARLYDHQMEQRERDIQQRAAVAPVAASAPRPAVVTPPATVTYSTPAPVAPPTPPAPPVPHAPVEPHRPIFPESDPGLINTPLDNPNTIITPSPDSENRPIA